MNILEAINQKSFDSSYEKAVVNLLYTHNWIRDRQQEVFKPYGLKMQHYNVLRILKGRYPEAYSPGEIKEVMLDKAPDLTRLIDKMVDMGLIDRHLCPDNRRKMNVLITDKGQTLVNEITQLQATLRERIQNRMSESEAEQLSDLLDMMRN
jgi:DNA-binding MarR family transcriptional regulator